MGVHVDWNPTVPKPGNPTIREFGMFSYLGAAPPQQQAHKAESAPGTPIRFGRFHGRVSGHHDQIRENPRPCARQPLSLNFKEIFDRLASYRGGI